MSKKRVHTSTSQKIPYGVVVTSTVWLIGTGAVFYHFVERLSWLDAVYFTVMTLATVGYGDIVPRTAAGKVFTIFYVFIGITIFVVLARLILNGLIARNAQRRRNQS